MVTQVIKEREAKLAVMACQGLEVNKDNVQLIATTRKCICNNYKPLKLNNLKAKGQPH